MLGKQSTPVRCDDPGLSCLQSAVVLYSPDFTDEFIGQMDASGIVQGVILGPVCSGKAQQVELVSNTIG